MQNNNVRSYGIDLAKIISMMMIVLLHNLLQGGVLMHVNATSVPINMGYWLVENFAIVAVNLFAIITGYLMVNKKVSVKRIVELWMTVLFWSVTICGIFLVFGFGVTTRELILSIIPTISGRYWYFNAYLMLVLFIPFLNAGIKQIDINFFEKIIGCLVVLSMTIGFVGKWFELDGYSGIWLIILYLIGAYIKVSPRIGQFKNRYLILIFVVCAIISLLAEYISLVYVGGVKHWLSYLSPMVIISSVSLFILLTRVKVSSPYLQKILKIVSPLTFAVYLLDTHPLIFNHIIKGAFIGVLKYNFFIGILIIVGISIGLFCLFIAMEFVRVELFSLVQQINRTGNFGNVKK